MKLDEIVAWYQKKIGTHDKQQWEKTVEQKILSGFSSIKLKNAKLKTELIDVDLVRGSTFPKAKPKQTLLTVIRLAILRYFFLPIYAQWWVHQTSANTFGVLLFLYVTQMINWAIYTFNMHHLTNVASHRSIVVNNNNATVSSRFTESVDPVDADEPSISVAELLIPMALSLLLSLIHSQIVATNSAGGSIKSKHRRFSNASVNGHRVPARLRRRKKLVKSRSQDNSDAGTAGINLKVASTTQRKLNSKLTSGLEVLDKSVLGVPSNNYNTKDVISSQQGVVSATSATAMLATASISSEITYNNDVTKESSCSLPSNVSKPKIDLGIINDSKVSPTVNVANKTINSAIISNSFISNSSIKPSTDKLIDGNLQTINTLVKRRNVNWHSPVHNYAIEMNEKQQQTSPQATESSEPSSSYSWDGSSSSSSNSININLNTESVTKPINIDDGVQEFYDNLMDEATETTTTAVTNARSSLVQQPAGSLNKKRIIGEDDGFESLNGKSSSGEEGLVGTRVSNNDSNFISTDKQQLRFRLKASELSETAKRLTTKVVQNAALTAAASFRHHIPLSFESDYDHMHTTNADMNFKPAIRQRSTMTKPQSTDETDEDGDDDAQTLTSPSSVRMNSSTYNECTTSATEWLGVTTNSEECSYSSEPDNSDDFKKDSAAVSDEDYDGYDFTPTTILNPHGTPADRISCTIWDQRVAKKAQMSVLEISSSIIERVESMPETNDYIYIGIFFSVILSLIPSFCRLCEITINSENPNEIKYLDLPMLLWEKASCSFMTILKFAFGQTQWERSVLIIGFIQRVCLTLILFTIFAVAERTFKQRFLYGKLFSHLTSSRRARKSNLPHFRLNKVRNIKTWLSVRSYLKKRGPQRSVDVIVSAAFIVTLLLLAFLSVEWLKDSVYMHSHLNLEALMWSVAIGIFLLRFMTLGNKIHHKYRSVSVLITEQINLYLQIEQKPKKKEELMVSNSVLKLAADLLKELETPFKISGLSANPYLFTTIKVVILSALSGVLSEMLGFKLKLHKITIK